MRLSSDAHHLLAIWVSHTQRHHSVDVGTDVRVGGRSTTHHAQPVHGSTTVPLAKRLGNRGHHNRETTRRSWAPASRRYLGFLGTLFLFVATASLFTIVPGYEPPTGSLSTTAALALCVFVAVPLFGIESRGLGGYLKAYLQPTGRPFLPFNIIGEFSRTLALAARLFGNMMSGTMIFCHFADHHAIHFPDCHECTRTADRYGAGLHLQHLGHGVHRGCDAYPRANTGTGTKTT